MFPQLLEGAPPLPARGYYETGYRRNIDWKNEPHRYPLLIRGAGQVGKSDSIRKLGIEEFDNLVEINFEQHPQYQSCFNSPEPENN